MAFKPLEPAGPSRRQLILVGSGLLLAAVATAGAWLALNAPSSRPSAPDARTLAMQPQDSTCQMAPAAAIAGAADGRFPLMADLSGLISADIASLVVLGQEVAAARPRDAEVAFLMSCRLAERLKGVDSVESADARQQLALHYARLGAAAGPGAGGPQAELTQRAEKLHAESQQTYHARLGKTHEKSRLAAEGLAATRQTLAQAKAPQAAPLVPLPAPEPVARQPVQEASLATPLSARPLQAQAMPAPPPAPAAARLRPQPTVAAKAAPMAPPRARAPTAVRPIPSFNCAKARSIPEKMICADPQLAQLDRDLGRLHARARNAAPDHAAFRRQSDQEWLRREANCRDRQCLLRWYAQRREQLVSQIEGPHQARAFRYGAGD